ncbi:O-acetyltransferase OatA [Bacillus sp. THAF10]|uniref:acyltransferase family protein n=1 Tax=Bacillus sp. THAF10 TaxID=2587848 RepID=UPI0012691E9E|nr:acyltransferase family protein [Bacillus sp. THAF10]QFT90877.1 O-acetyltransferase OatA [Bacillus sp. THAF10]
MSTSNQPKIPTNKRFRTEIEGLRAVAALLVAIYHIWLGNVSGGVDVFFVVSGFLITTSLLGRIQREGTIDFIDYILGLTKRLFPAAFFVLLIVTIASMLWLPQVQWAQTVQEIMASALYYQNWQLAFNAVDYLAQNNEASPVQHFWAMSIQGQFYLLWPTVVFGLALLLHKVLKLTFKATLISVLVTVFTTSLTYSIYLTATNQAFAYFHTFTRVWEFALGGIVAIVGAQAVLKKSISFLIGWVGLFAIILCGILLQVSTVFPGYAALWPTLAAIFIILAGNNGGSFGVHRFLSLKPLAKLGNLSYALYLWHWPILIFYFHLSDNETVSITHGLLILAASIILASITTNIIEKPIRTMKKTSPKWKRGSVVIACMVPTIILATTWSHQIGQANAELASLVTDSDYPGALASFHMQETKEGVEILPSALQAKDDLPKVYMDKCHQTLESAEVISCEYGVTDNPDKTIVIVGGSHSAQWLPAFEEFAEEENMKIINYTKSSCRFSDEEEGPSASASCVKWNEELIDILLNTKPDLVFTTADVGRKAEVPEGFVNQWHTLNKAGIKVFAIRDNAWFEFDVPSCVEEKGANSPECALPREEALPSDGPFTKLENVPDNVHYADFTDYLCEEDTCKPVKGNVLIYRDKHHITATYVRTMAPLLRKEVKEVLK